MIVSTYQPRHCGIAVFSADLRSALLEADSSLSVEVVSMVRDELEPHPPEVVATIRQDVAGDYRAAAEFLDAAGPDAVLIEHEYGIFGGKDGAYVTDLARSVDAPVVVTLHTMLADPSPGQAAILRALCDAATLVMVFTGTARRMVLDQGLAGPERVRVVPHGAPELLAAGAWSGAGSARAPTEPDPARSLGLPSLAGRTVLSTFGLISAAKGLELAIGALPAVVAAHPEVVYLIAGQTHPEVISHEGESYRLRLERLVRDLSLDEHVAFLDRFLTVEELAALLARTDLYLTPYRSRDQIVSGALTFAVAAGCPVVSTPYFYAEDLLRTGAGVLVPFDDPEAWAAAVLGLLDSPEKLAAARAEARRVGAELTWPSVGKATLEVLAEAAGAPVRREDRDRR